MNQEYIAKNFCENKNIPEKKCNGKCHLTKQIKKIEQTEDNKNKSSAPTLKSEVEFLYDFISSIPNNYVFSNTSYLLFVSSKKSKILFSKVVTPLPYLDATFHPPPFLV